MTVTEIAKTYVTLCQQGKFEECLEQLFSKDAVSVEALTPPGVDKVATGMEAIRAKGKAWIEAHEVHSLEVTGPYPNDQRFIARFVMDVTNKPSKKRMTMDELGLFTVENGKITREEFFYQGG